MRPIERLFLQVIAVLATVILVAGPGRSEENRSGLAWMSAEEIRATFSGKQLSGLYPSNRPWDETIHADGSTDYAEGTKRWHGTWWVENREFCFSYPPPGVGGCFRVTRISANCFELYEFTGSPGQAEEPPNVADLWNGRMWRRDSPMTCEARPSV